jgi:membrane dipeptidase
MPVGLEDVSKYPNLFERLAQIDEPKWSKEDLKKLAGLNLIRVFKEVEKVRDKVNCDSLCANPRELLNLSGRKVRNSFHQVCSTEIRTASDGSR